MGRIELAKVKNLFAKEMNLEKGKSELLDTNVETQVFKTWRGRVEINRKLPFQYRIKSLSKPLTNLFCPILFDKNNPFRLQ